MNLEEFKVHQTQAQQYSKGYHDATVSTIQILFGKLGRDERQNLLVSLMDRHTESCVIEDGSIKSVPKTSLDESHRKVREVRP